MNTYLKSLQLLALSLGILCSLNAKALNIDCDDLQPDRTTVLHLNLTNQKGIGETVRMAAVARGENAVIVGGRAAPEIIDLNMLYKVFDQLKTCHAQLSSLVISGHDGGAYYWGSHNAGFAHSELLMVMRHYSSVTQGIRSTYFWGCNSYASGFLTGIYRPEDAAIPKSLAPIKDCDKDDKICERHAKNFDPLFTGAFPIDTIWGDDQGAFTNDNPIVRNHLYLLMIEEKRLNAINDSEQVKQELNQIRCESVTHLSNPACANPTQAALIAARSVVAIAGSMGDLYYTRLCPRGKAGASRHCEMELVDITKPPTPDVCANELSSNYGKMLTPLLEARKVCDEDECSDGTPTDFREIINDTYKGIVRVLYEFAVGNSDCQNTSDPVIASKFPNVSVMRDLVFYNQIRSALWLNHGKELRQLETDLASLQIFDPKLEIFLPAEVDGGCRPGTKVCHPRILKRADLLHKLRRIQLRLKEMKQDFPTVKEALFLTRSFYQILTLQPDSTFKTPRCPSWQGTRAKQTSCLLNAMVPPGWLEIGSQRSPIFENPPKH